jgi:PleD family two-component response regulator
MQTTALRTEAPRPRSANLDPLINAIVLDDSTFDRRRLRRMSREAGLPLLLDEVDSIDALQKALDDEVFDVVFLDYRLPVGNGLIAHDVVRKHPRHAECPTIMLAGNDDPDVGLQALRMGSSDYVLKSRLTADGLRDVVNSAIAKAERQSLGALQRHELAVRLRQSLLTQVSVAIQPEVAGVVRTARSIRTSLAADDINLQSELEALEARCLGLWALVSSLEVDVPN